jgi:hypothetical protein
MLEPDSMSTDGSDGDTDKRLNPGVPIIDLISPYYFIRGKHIVGTVALKQAV